MIAKPRAPLAARRARPFLAALALAAATFGCGRSESPAPPTPPREGGAAPDWSLEPGPPEPRPGMVWVPPGLLLVGTPAGRIPRVADEEMTGEQVMMRGFFVDVFPYPNEPGAIPTTHLDQGEARAACEAQGKRLCTELEIERACKGPENWTYEYGDVYRPSVCGTGSTRSLVPNGYHAGCRSAFGVQDLHGGIWSWTKSAWGRGTEGLVALRGGNGPAGELVGRCANGMGRPPTTRRDDIGVRCCAGEANSFEVELRVVREEPLLWRKPDAGSVALLEPHVPPAVRRDDAHPGLRFRIERMWIWHPTGNEELVVAGGCARRGAHGDCGVLVARVLRERAEPLGWVSTEWWQPEVREAERARELFVHGGDANGAFRRRLSYLWGRIGVGDPERKRRRAGQSRPTYD